MGSSVKFMYSEKATKVCEISTVDLTGTTYIEQIYGGDFAKFCGLLRIYELYFNIFCVISYLKQLQYKALRSLSSER